MYASMEDEDYVPMEAKDFYKIYVKAGALSPEIVKNPEIQEEDSESPNFTESTSEHVVVNDVYVAVGKDDTDVLKWTLENAASSGITRVFLVHVFPPVTHVPTPVGRLARSQLNDDQVRLYVKEESNKRSNLMQKYVNLCNDAKVTAETILLESNCTEKSIVELIPVLRITHLVIGTKRHSRREREQFSLGEFVKNNAPDFCEVSIVHAGKKVEVNQQVNGPTTQKNTRHFDSNDVYVAVGKDDIDVLKWTLENAASRVFLVHVFPPITNVPTPVGRLARSQLNEDQVRLYVKEESNKRSNLMQKYVNLCNDANVTAETILLESNCTETSILDLIPALSITHLVIGTKRHSRRARKQLLLGEFVKNNAPDFCEVSIIHKGNKVEVNQQVDGPTTPENTRHFEKTPLFSCFPVCGKAKIS